MRGSTRGAARRRWRRGLQRHGTPNRTGHGGSWGRQAYWCNTNVKPGPVLQFDVAKGVLRPPS